MSSNSGYIKEPALVQGNHSFSSITALIADIVEKPTPFWWYIAFGISNMLLGVLFMVAGLPHLARYRDLGPQQHRCLGLGYRELCMVGWYRPRGYADFCRTVFVQTGMANGY